ncbi:MAG: DinB family protein [Anaerolineae bacterium]|nr:DinB family protein [Anaerolineae bacterium]
MTSQIMHLLYTYNDWANQRIWRAAEALAADEFEKDLSADFSFGSLRGTLVHIMGAEWLWLSRWQGVSPRALLKESDFPTLAAVSGHWIGIAKGLLTYAMGLTDDDLRNVVHYTNTQGKAFAYPLGQLMMHLANHSTHHRSEAATILTHFGHPPDPLDMIAFYAETRR